MYKQNDEQTLIQTKVTLSELETKSLHLCQITTWHATQVCTSKNLLRTQIFIDCGLFLALQIILTIFFSDIVNISCTLSIYIVRVIALSKEFYVMQFQF